MKFKNLQNSRMSATPSPLSHRKKIMDPQAVPLHWYTISIIFIWTNQTFVNQMNSSVLSVYYLLLVPHSSGRWYCGTAARQTPPDHPPPYFPELGASPPPGKGISEIAAKRYYRIRPSAFKLTQLLGTNNVKELCYLGIFLQAAYIRNAHLYYKSICIL